MSKTMLRFALATASILAVAGIMAPAASAAPVSRVAAHAVPSDAVGCDGFVCISVMGPADGYTAVGYDDDLFAIFYGHIQLVGPGISSDEENGPDEWSPSHQASGIGRGYVCAIAWMYLSPGNYSQQGTACEKVS